MINNFGLSFSDEQSLIKTNFIIQYYFAKNFSDDILSDIISFKYNLNFQNSSYLIIGVSKEFDHFNDKDDFERDMKNWILNKQIKWSETIVEGIENAPKAFLDLLNGKNIGKMLVKI